MTVSWLATRQLRQIILLGSILSSCEGMNSAVEVKTNKEAVAAKCVESGKCIKDPTGLVIYNKDLVTENLIVKQTSSDQTLLTQIINLIDEPKLLVTSDKIEPLMRGVTIVKEADTCDAPSSIRGLNPTVSQLRELKEGRYKACIAYVGEGLVRRVYSLDPIAVDMTAPKASIDPLTTSSLTYNSSVITWSKASDNVSLESDLAYSVYLSTTQALDTIDSVRSLGTPQPGKVIDVTSYALQTLIQNTKYYAAVVVTDDAGNQALVGATTFSTPPSETASAPLASPTMGVYITAQSVTLTSATPGAKIYYTTDGSQPTAQSSVYASPIAVNATQTIKAFAVAANYNDSTASTFVYTITGTAQAPTFSVPEGSYGPAQTVTLSSGTPGATIFFTTNGDTPTRSATRYTGPISISSSQTIKAFAVLNDWADSGISSATYTINGAVVTPTFSVPGGPYGPAQSVTISTATPGATIYYTTDGSQPSITSPAYSGAINISSSTTLNAIAVKSGFSNSAVATAAYTINGQAGAPLFSVASGTYASAQTVTISSTTSGSSIYYTTNGSDPTTASTLYSGPLTITSDSLIKAITVKSGFSDSSITTGSYVIMPEAQSNIPRANLLGYWNFENATPTSYPSQFGSSTYTFQTGNDGRGAVNAGTSVLGKAGNGISFGTSGFQGLFISSGSFPILTTFTVTAWVKLNALNSNLSVILNSWDGTNGWNFLLGVDNTGKLTGNIGIGGTTVQAGVKDTYVNFADGQWHFVAMQVLNSSYYRVKTDNNPWVSASITGSLAGATSRPLQIAQNRAQSVYNFNGIVDELSVWQSALTDTEINSMRSVTSNNSLAAASTPTASPAAGSYTTPQQVTLSSTTPGASIYYTTDGSSPTNSSSLYTAPITVSASQTIRAIASFTGNIDSSVASFAYVIDGTAPVITAASVTTTSPGTTLTPSVSFTSNEAGTFQLFKDSNCLSFSAIISNSGSMTSGSNTTTTNSLTANTSTNIYVQATDALSNFSCTLIGSYTHDNTSPVAPVIADASKSFNTAFTTSVQQGIPADTNFKEFRYTFDGTNPTCSTGTASTTQPLSIAIPASTTLLKVISCDQVSLASPVATSTFTFDNTAPTVSISSSAATITKVSPIPLTITFSEAVTGFVDADISVTNGVVSGFSGSGTTYTASVTPSAQGSVTVSIAANLAQDGAGNGNTASNQLARTFDSVAPGLTNLSIVSTSPSSTNLTPTINFNLDEYATVRLWGDSGCGLLGLSFYSARSAGTQTIDSVALSDSAVTNFYIKATDNAGNSSSCLSLGSYTTQLPATTMSTPTRQILSLDLAWNPVSGASSYNLYWSNTSGVTTSSNLLSNVSAPYTHSSLTGAINYYYKVAAVKNGVIGELSSEVSAMPYSGAAPTITGITPTSGSSSGGTPVTISGTGFFSGATVSIGGNAATAVTFGSSTSLTATTPAGTVGAKSVTVTNPDGQSVTLSDGFTYYEGQQVDALVVGGGGGGGQNFGGGGGAGGFIESQVNITLSAGMSISVGAGGSHGGGSGGNSKFGNLVAVGGGGGATGYWDYCPTCNGASGGSGGGGGRYNGSGGSGTAGQGNSGGSPVDNFGGGGGGAGGAAPNGATGVGGAGKKSTITGSDVYYAAGGGGGSIYGGQSGGQGGGGTGGGWAGGAGAPGATAGTANTGSGGGGGVDGGNGAGGSGVVILKFPVNLNLSIDPDLTYTSTMVSGYKIYSFTAGSGIIYFYDPNQNSIPKIIKSLVVGGGGGGGGGGQGYGGTAPGGGGAGGFVYDFINYSLGSSYNIAVGAGGGENLNGDNSVFSDLVAIGGGAGGTLGGPGAVGGSGGGGSSLSQNDPYFQGGAGGSGTAGQGHAGGWPGAYLNAGGGGGAGGPGAGGCWGQCTPGGPGRSSSITGTSVYYAGGGGGGETNGYGASSGGIGGGGTGGGYYSLAASGQANTGGGGGGGGRETAGGSGGSGIVILRFDSRVTATIGAGLTYSTSTVGSDTVISFTAGSGTVSFSP